MPWYWMYSTWLDSQQNQYQFSLQIDPYKGPGTYTPKNQRPDALALMELTKNEAVDQPIIKYKFVGDQGSVTVGPDKKSGHFDGNFLTENGGQLRVYGSWACSGL